MGYIHEKRKKGENRRRRGVILLALFIFLVVSLSVFSLFVPEESWKYYFALPKVTERKDGELRIHFLDVGQADATLIELPDGQVMLIDGGDVDGAQTVLRYLNALKIKKIDYLLLTHTDIDHCGSLKEVVKYKEIGEVFLPYVQEDGQTNSAFEEFGEELAKGGVKTKIAKRYAGVTSSMQECTYQFSVLFPYSAESGGNESFSGNALSTITLLEYNGFTGMFCGDTNETVLQKLCEEDELGLFNEKGIYLNSVELLKYPHHGAKDGANTDILSYLNVKTAVISCGKNNYYGHPNGETLSILGSLNVDTYRTDWHGSIVVTVFKNGEYKTEYSAKE